MSWRGVVLDNVEAELHWTEDDLQRILAPTLLIAGESGFTVSLEQMLSMRRSIPNSEMLILNHAGLDGLANHRVQFTRADAVGPVILDFLERHAGTTAPAVVS